MKKRKWWKRVLGICLAACAALTAVPQLPVQAATYTDHTVVEGTELFDIGGKNFSYLSYDGYSRIEHDGSWMTYMTDGSLVIQNTASSTPQTGAMPGRWIRVTFDNIGTMNGRQVRGVMEFTDMEGNNIYNPFLGIQRPTNAITISNNNFWSGFIQSYLQMVTLTVRLYYADTGEQINMTGMYTTIGSLKGEVDQPHYPDPTGGWEAVRLNYSGTVNAYRLRDDRGNNPQITSPGSSMSTGIIKDAGWYIGNNYEFEDALGSSNFLKSAVSFQIPGRDVSLTYWGYNCGVAWYSFNLSPFGSSAIPPEKTVEDIAGNDINGTALYPGDTLVYRTNQRMEILGVDGTARYKSFTMTDTVPDGLDIQRVELQQKTAGGNSYSLMPSTSYSYQIVKNSDGTQTVTLTLANPNSTNPWLYSGETLSMTIVCQVNETMWNYTTFGRNASVSINGNGRDTNGVNNSISYRILTDVVNGTIDPDETRILRGSDRTIEYAPNDGYYVKSVTVDGVSRPITEFLDSYTFQNITGNHEIQVVCAKQPVITITKQIDRDSVVWAKGSPIFTFKISGTDYLGKERTYYRMISFSENESAESKSITVNIPAGQWTITELTANDWSLSTVKAGTSCEVSGNAGILDTLNTDAASVTFINGVSDYSNYTHNGAVVNDLK